MDEGEGSVSENGAENFEMIERTSMITITLFCTELQKRVLMQHESRNQFWKPTIQNSIFKHSHGNFNEKRSHLCPRRSVSHNSVFLLCIGLVLSQLHKTLLWDINKFVYSCVLVPCRLAEEDKIDVSKLLFLICNCLKNMEVNDLQSHTYCMLGTQHALRYFCWSS